MKYLIFALLVTKIATFCYKKSGADWNSPMCQDGKKQSPINIDTKHAQCNENIKQDIQFIDEKHSFLPRMYPNDSNDISSIRVNMHFSNLTVTQEQQKEHFKALQFHFHTPSEHSVDGKYYDVEMHIVHQIRGGDKLAVMGIFFDVDEEINDETETFFHKNRFDLTNMNQVLAQFNAKNSIEDLYNHNQKFYHYEGSLTTPPCTEDVNWFLLSEPMAITKKQLDQIQVHFQQNLRFAQGKGNNRFQQPLNGRIIKEGGQKCNLQQDQFVYNVVKNKSQILNAGIMLMFSVVFFLI